MIRDDITPRAVRIDLSPDPAETEDGTAESDIEFEKAGPSVIMLVLFAAVGAGVGGWFGAPIVGPQIQAILASGGDGGDAESDGGGHGPSASTSGKSGGHGGGGGGEAPAEPIAIENLILNPAGSQGSRFLIASLVLDTDAATGAELASRDAEARDLLLTILATRTVEELSNISLRDEIREDLRAALNTMLGREAVHRIFLPQFVIQ